MFLTTSVARFCTSIMDIQTLLHNLHEEVSCSVCMTKFTDPKQLPCLHSFCLHCLEGIQRTSARQDEIACPECRRVFRIPGGGNLNEFPTNFRLNSLLDVLAIKECQTSRVKCENCDKRSEHCFYCFQCCSFWCDDCISLHNGIKANKEHHALALKDFQDQNFENILKRPAFCQQKHHETEELKFFCIDCKVAICNSCVATIHDGHAKMILKEVADKRKLQMKSAIESRKQNVQRKMIKIAELDEQCAKIQAQAARVKTNAQMFADKIIAMVEVNKLDIFQAVDNQAKESVEHLEKQKQEFQDEIKVQEAKIEKTERLLKRSSIADIVQCDSDVLSSISPKTDSDKEDQVDRHDLESLRQFVFVENKTLEDKLNTEGFGSFKTFFSKSNAQQSSAKGLRISDVTVGLEAQIVVTTRNAQGEQCYEERDCVTVEITNRQGHDCATQAQVQDNKDGTYKISYFATETGTCQASVMVNGEHVRGSPFKVQVKPRNFRPVLSFGQQGSSAGMFSNPWGIAVNEKNEIAVTDTSNHRIQVFSSNGTHLRSFGRMGDQQGEFNWSAGIAFHNDSIIVADRGNHRVQLFSDQGKYLGKFGEEGNLHHQVNYPTGLSINSDGNIIVSDTGNKLIKIFSPKGNLACKIGREGSFTNPVHCIQLGKYLIVSDGDEHCIKVFDLEGNFLYKFGKEGDGDGEFNEPRCLSVNKAGQLMVCDAGNHRIQVFEPNGKFVTKFGSYSAVGQFIRPISAALLSDGKIVVSDILNHRIQIFE